MKRTAIVAPLILVALLSACNKREKAEEAPAAAPTPAAASPAPVPAPGPSAEPAAASAPAAPPAEQTQEQRDLARKQALLAFATMEDKYINDPRAQWAIEAKASTEYGQNRNNVYDTNRAKNIVGAADGKDWTNDNIDKGFDWIEAAYATPVNATEVRLVLTEGKGVESIIKVELQDTEAKWHTVWEGMSEVKKDKSGNRTWFVRTFDKTPYKAKGVKVTFANNLQHEYKTADAMQLVGDH